VNAGSDVATTTTLKLSAIKGFVVRPPTPHETASLLDFFPTSPLGNENLSLLGAFGQPGDVPLGALIVRPASRGGTNVGHFQVFVRPDARRRGIGSTLMTHLYQLASRNFAARLVLAELVHEDSGENAFCRAVGLSTERSFNSYSIPIELGVMNLCRPIANRFERSHPHLARTDIVPLESLDPEQLALFITTHYTGFLDERVRRLRAGAYNRELSVAAVRGGEILAAMLVCTKAGERSVMIDLIVTAPPLRRGPAPIVLLQHAGETALARGYVHCVFEADESHDFFAVGSALRCGSTAQWKRHRYAIEKREIDARASAADPVAGDAVMR
jgi:GNAT superfamily N-acetyltransferase